VTSDQGEQASEAAEPGAEGAVAATPTEEEPTEPGLPPAVDLPPDEALPFLATAEMEIVGRLVSASNITLLVALHGDVPGRGHVTAGAVYKPVRGERPLWDFPDGTLAGREVAAHLLSAAAGWDVVPPTILREDAPVGPGMLQLWVETGDDVDVVDLVRAGDARLRPIALFDAIANNGDRKGGHLLVRPDGRIQGVDHGVTFNVDPKLRTILWGWRGTALTPAEIRVLLALRRRWAALGESLGPHLLPAEIAAARARLDDLLLTGLFPQPSPDWPAVPWPWY
jgi:uncharacterized repeat protein (TIGR03843 family)